MKKLFYMISAVALMASFASCNKIEQGNTSAETPSVDGTTTITVSASVPQTKTYILGNAVRWSANDVIAILAEKYDPVRSELIVQSAETHDFTIKGWYEGVIPQYAAFTGPYTSDDNYNPYKPVWNADGTIQMTVRSGQVIYNQDSFSKIANISLGELVEKDGVFSTEMKNVCGLLKFTLTKQTESVVFEDMDGGYMCGKVNVKMVDGVPEAAFVDGTGGKITLTSNIKDSGKLLAHNGSYTYYAVVIPGTYTPKVTITPKEGNRIELQARTPITVRRNEYIDLGTLDSSAEEDGDEPVTPDTNEKTLDINFSSFSPSLPSSATKTKETYALTIEEETYSFTLYSPAKGYWLTGGKLRMVGKITSGDNTGYPGYMTLPGIADYKLTSVMITGGNDSGTKTYKIFDKDPIDENVTDEVELGSVAIKQLAEGKIQLNNTIAGNVYYLCCPGMASDSNAQMSKLVLTYTK